MDAYIPPEVRRAARRVHNEDARPQAQPYPLTPWCDLTDEEKLRQLVSNGAMSAPEAERMRADMDMDRRNERIAGALMAAIFVAGFVAIALWG